MIELLSSIEVWDWRLLDISILTKNCSCAEYRIDPIFSQIWMFFLPRFRKWCNFSPVNNKLKILKSPFFQYCVTEDPTAFAWKVNCLPWHQLFGEAELRRLKAGRRTSPYLQSFTTLSNAVSRKTIFQRHCVDTFPGGKYLWIGAKRWFST